MYIIVYGFQLISMFDIQYVIYNHVFQVFGCPFVYIAIFQKKSSQKITRIGETWGNRGFPRSISTIQTNHISSATQLRWQTLMRSADLPP